VCEEGTDRTLLGPVQIRAVYWSVVMTNIWYCFVFEEAKQYIGFQTVLFCVSETTQQL